MHAHRIQARTSISCSRCWDSVRKKAQLHNKIDRTTCTECELQRTTLCKRQWHDSSCCTNAERCTNTPWKINRLASGALIESWKLRAHLLQEGLRYSHEPLALSVELPEVSNMSTHCLGVVVASRAAASGNLCASSQPYQTVSSALY